MITETRCTERRVIPLGEHGELMVGCTLLNGHQGSRNGTVDPNEEGIKTAHRVEIAPGVVVWWMNK